MKSEQSPAERCRSNENNAEIKEIKEKFNVLANNFSKKKKIRRKFCFAEEIDKHLKELEKK